MLENGDSYNHLRAPLEIEPHFGGYSAVFGARKVSEVKVSGNSSSFTIPLTEGPPTVTISGNVEGDRITGEYVINDYVSPGSTIGPYVVHGRTWKLTGTRLAP